MVSAGEDQLKSRRILSILLGSFLLDLVVARCGGSGSNRAGGVEAPASQVLTPLILSIQDAPVPFTGSDGKTHVVYEVFVTNFTSVTATVEQVDVLGDGNELQTLDSTAVAGRLQPAGQATSSDVMPTGAQSLLFVHVILASGASVPRNLSHRFTVNVHGQELVQTGGNTRVNAIPVAIIGPPLHGNNYVSADSCCDATRHQRAALPVNSRIWGSH